MGKLVHGRSFPFQKLVPKRPGANARWGLLSEFYGIPVMQCFRVEYRGICHASLVFFVYIPVLRRMCIRRKKKRQVACSTVSHEKALHNYFSPCLNLQKSYGNFRKSSAISRNFRKLRKRFKSVFEKLKRFIRILENLWQSSKNIEKTSRTVPNSFKISRKPSGVLGNFRKTMITVQNCFLDDFMIF